MSLSELPDNIETIYCNNNLLTKIPENLPSKLKTIVINENENLFYIPPIDVKKVTDLEKNEDGSYGYDKYILK